MEAVGFKAGETIISEGDAGDTAFFIVSGSVDVIIGQGAKAKTVGSLNEGEVFGEMSMIEPGPRSATIRTAIETTALTSFGMANSRLSAQSAPMGAAAAMSGRFGAPRRFFRT
jgi:signal-transduction protein with cAMP-binding, CBS, and nucleotidyltransferase domain